MQVMLWETNCSAIPVCIDICKCCWGMSRSEISSWKILHTMYTPTMANRPWDLPTFFSKMQTAGSLAPLSQMNFVDPCLPVTSCKRLCTPVMLAVVQSWQSWGYLANRQSLGFINVSMESLPTSSSVKVCKGGCGSRTNAWHTSMSQLRTCLQP